MAAEDPMAGIRERTRSRLLDGPQPPALLPPPLAAVGPPPQGPPPQRPPPQARPAVNMVRRQILAGPPQGPPPFPRLVANMAGRQVARPPFVVDQQYKLFNAYNPATSELVTYVGQDARLGNDRFLREDGTEINIDTAGPLYGTQGLFIGYTGNAGGRRKSRRSKRSKRSHRKTKRRHN